MTDRRRNGTWAPGHGPALGRGIRNKHVREIYEDANRHWNEIEPTSGKRKGEIALELTFRENSAEYIRWQRSLNPRNYEHTAHHTDEQLEEAMRWYEEQRTIEQRTMVRLSPVKDKEVTKNGGSSS